MTEPKDKDRVTCLQCEYSARCFPVLKWFFSHLCQQGRRKKEYRQKQATLPEGDEIVL